MPIYVYVMGMLFYVMAGIFAVPALLLLALLPPARQFGLRTAAGIMGSYAGVLFFQLVTFPIVLLFCAPAFIDNLVPLRGAVDAVLTAVLVLVMMAWMSVSSVVGFFVGWRTGSKLAAGVPLRSAARSALQSSRLVTWLLAKVGRPLRPPPA